MTLLSMRQYAKHRGVSPEAVSKAVKTGRISTVSGEKPGQRLINPEVADREWDANTDAGRQRKEAQKPAPIPEKPSKGPEMMPSEASKAAAPASILREREQEPEQQGQKAPSFAQSAAFQKAYQARIAKLHYEEKAGKLVDADKVKVEAFRVGRIVRDAILGVADRISFKLAAETDERKVNLMLKNELIAAMEELTLAGRRS